MMQERMDRALLYAYGKRGAGLAAVSLAEYAAKLRPGLLLCAALDPQARAATLQHLECKLEKEQALEDVTALLTEAWRAGASRPPSWEVR